MNINKIYFDVLNRTGKVSILSDKRFAEELAKQASAKLSSKKDYSSRGNTIYTVYK